MAAEWYYAKNKQKVGPMTFEQLKELVRSVQLAPTDMVWQQGMAKLTEASQVEGLFESSPPKTVPPPIPPAPPPLPVAEWHVIKDGKQRGPVTVEQLRASIAPGDLVWRAGLTQWVAASTIPGLFPGGSSNLQIPPPPASVQKPSLRIEELMKTGRQKNARGEYQLAIDAFTEVIRLDPNDANAYFGRGDAYYGIAHRTNDYRAAMADFREALRLSPGHEDAKLYLQEAQKRHQDPSPTPEVGISDPAVAKQAAQKKAAAQWHAKPVEKKSLSEPEHTVFAGDAPCPKCKTVIWVEWQNVTVAMACPKCGFRFDHDEAIAFLSAHKPEDNYKADEAAAAVEAVDVLERAKALLASHEAPATSEETALLEDIAQLEKQIEESGIEARATGDWSRDTELNSNLLILKQQYEQMQKARHKAAVARDSKKGMQGKQPRGSSTKASSASSEPDPISMICPHCLVNYRARLYVGATTRCDKCLEDFVVYRHMPAESFGDILLDSIKGMNPLSWFTSEKCPQCRSVAVKLGNSYHDAGYIIADGRMVPEQVYRPCYLCNKCQITWDRYS